MKIIIEKSILLEALQLVVSISPKASTQSVINNVFLEALTINGDNFLQVKATNYDKTFLGNFPVEIIEPGQLCMNTYRLYNLVKEFRGTSVQIRSTPQNWVYLSCDHSQVKLPCIDSGLFPVVEFRELTNQFKLPAQIFKNAIDRTIFCIGENESRKNLMGLNLQIISPTQIQWLGADGFRIAQFITNLEVEIESQGNIIIPKNALVDIKKILTLSEEEITICFNENEIQILTEKMKFKTRLIEADFPNLDTLLNSIGRIKVGISKDEIINAIRIIHTLTEGEPNSFVKFTFQDGKLLISSQKLDFGEGNDEISCDYEEEEVNIGLNVRLLLEALQSFESSPDDMIYFNFSKTVTPVSLTCEEWENFLTILMPVQIEW